MKYIYYIATVIVGALALIIIQFIADRPASPENPAIVINDRVITVEELAGIKQAHDELRPDFIDSIITKELMIQEARRSGIDREEQFRKSIQNFYEQSLVKTLMERKFASLNITVSDEEIDRYYSMMDKKFSLIVARAESLENLEQGKNHQEKLDISFADLSGKMKNMVFSLRKGEKSPPFLSGNDYIIVTLEDVQPGGDKRQGLTKDAVKKLISEDKRERMIAEWIDGMRKKAKITIHKSAGNGG
jgi:hypothetical protein